MGSRIPGIAVVCAMSFGGCTGTASIGQIEQQLPGALTATETIAINTLILRYQELQRLKMVLDGLPVPQLPPLPPGPSPVPVVIVPPITPPVTGTPVPQPPAPVPPPTPVPVPQGLRSHAVRDLGKWPSFEQLAGERRTDFWTEHRPSYRLVAGSSGISAESAAP